MKKKSTQPRKLRLPIVKIVNKKVYFDQARSLFMTLEDPHNEELQTRLVAESYYQELEYAELVIKIVSHLYSYPIEVEDLEGLYQSLQKSLKESAEQDN